MSKLNPSLAVWEVKRGAAHGRALLVLAPCLLLLLALPAHAQKTSGQITGSVVDEKGAALPDTTVAITQTGTGLKREAQTNQDGIYTVQDLPPGVYQITATHSGFKEAVVASVTVNVSTTTRQDLTMQVGAVTEKVDIVATDVQVETETGTVGGVVN